MGPGLKRVGPNDPQKGFPMWYEDFNGLKLGLCEDALECAFAPPQPAAPVIWPSNYADEVFWWLADSALVAPNGGKALITLGLEGAFAGGGLVDGDQVSFARTRIRIEGLNTGATYWVTTPYGKFQFIATADAGPGVAGGGISYVADLGLGANMTFDGALKGRIGPFLVPSPAVTFTNAGRTYLAGLTTTPAVTVTGSPFGWNFFRIEGPGVATAANSQFTCADATLGPDPFSTSDCIETTLFSMQAVLPDRYGVAADRVTFKSNGSVHSLDVWARGGEVSNLQVSGPGVPTTNMVSDNAGNFYAHVDMTSALPGAITLTNTTDNPPTEITAAVKDYVQIASATFDINSRTLTVAATSSRSGDPAATMAVQSISGTEFTYTGANGAQVSGVAPATNAAPAAVVLTGAIPPPSVQVVSADGGVHTILTDIVSATPSAIANAGADMIVDRGQLVTVSGAASAGLISSYSWTQVGGPAVAVVAGGVSGELASFIFPADQSGVITLSLAVSPGPGLPSSTDQVVVVDRLIANAGADQAPATAAALVTLDASASVGPIVSYSWQQVVNAGDPVVVLSGANGANPTFTSPWEGGVLTFQLTLLGALGQTSTDTVTVSTLPGPPVANAGPDQAVALGDLVQLSAMSTQGDVTSYQWVQLSGPAVTLGVMDGGVLNTSNPAFAATLPTPVFRFPQAYGTVVFQLTVTNGIPGSPNAGSTTDQVSIICQQPANADTITVQRAQWRVTKRMWVIQGTSSVPGPGHSVTIWLGAIGAGQVIGTAPVDATGAFQLQTLENHPANPTLAGAPQTLSFISTLGGLRTNVPYTRK